MSSPTESIAEPDTVMLELDAETGEAAVRALQARLAATSDGVTDSALFLQDLLQRMKLAPIAMADDVAIPHARTSAVSRLVLGVARTRQPVSFDSAPSSVRLIFLIGTPKDAVTGYLQAVAMLLRVLRTPAIRAGLFAATEESEFRALLSGGVAAFR